MDMHSYIHIFFAHPKFIPSIFLLLFFCSAKSPSVGNDINLISVSFSPAHFRGNWKEKKQKKL